MKNTPNRTIENEIKQAGQAFRHTGHWHKFTAVESEVYVIKANGERTLFNPAQLIASLLRSGASDEMADKVLEAVREELHEGITTKQIYRRAFHILRKNAKGAASKYKLKRAILELGPTGYPFELLVGEIVRAKGLEAEVAVTMKGQCIDHEVDVVARRENELFMVECKFHRNQGRRTGVQVPLYIHSRFLDIYDRWKKGNGKGADLHLGWVVTNTRFTEDATKYGECVGLNMVSWDYPRSGGLRDQITFSGLHPITCLHSITRSEKRSLLEKGAVICKHILEQPEMLATAYIDKRKHTRIMREIEELFQ